jgi:hypothetical protein
MNGTPHRQKPKLTHYLLTLDNVCYVNLSMKLAQSAGLRTTPSNPERAGARDHASVWLGAQTGTFVFRGKRSAESWD